ncbi:MAG TPA: ATP-grasp domain-containing protein, partial [Acidimicrobiia bacterium]|nr:ATP-grasp domain-containing protein [Acidimicrobiia bacterium]
MNVVFVEPSFPANQKQFVRGLRQAGASVIGVGERPRHSLGPDVAGWLDHYEEVESVVDVGSLVDAVRRIEAVVTVDRLEATVEAHVEPAAIARQHLAIPGTSARTAFLCRDKPTMKETLREAGIPTAASAAVHSAEDLREFATAVGYPLIVKPRSGAGASGTVKIDDAAALEETIASLGLDLGASVAVEEFVEGHEGFWDTIAIGGDVAHEFVSHYYPNVLEAMRTRWISPQFITTNEVETAPGYREVMALGRRVLPALGIETSATHMEWFFGPKGLRFSEIGCRPPGVGAWDLYSAANEFDIYKDWAMAVCWGRVDQRLSRRYSAGIIALRPDRDGTIVGYDGLEVVQHEMS